MSAVAVCMLEKKIKEKNKFGQHILMLLYAKAQTCCIKLFETCQQLVSEAVYNTTLEAASKLDLLHGRYYNSIWATILQSILLFCYFVPLWKAKNAGLLKKQKT